VTFSNFHATSRSMTTVTFVDHVSDPTLAVDGRTGREPDEAPQALSGVEEATAEGSRLADLQSRGPTARLPSHRRRRC